MEARRLIASASFGPDALKVLFHAFDEAWAALAPRYANDQPAVSAARSRLASIMLGLAAQNSSDADWLRNTALQRYNESAGAR